MIRNNSDAGLLFWVIAATIAIGLILALFNPDANHDD